MLPLAGNLAYVNILSINIIFHEVLLNKYVLKDVRLTVRHNILNYVCVIYRLAKDQLLRGGSLISIEALIKVTPVENLHAQKYHVSILKSKNYCIFDLKEREGLCFLFELF